MFQQWFECSGFSRRRQNTFFGRGVETVAWIKKEETGVPV
jgi:hypothetical protein